MFRCSWEDMDKILDEVKEADNGATLLKNVYRVLFNVDLDDEEQVPIDVRDYRISFELAKELMDYCTDVLGEDAVEVNLLWLNYGPSMQDHLDYDTIEILAPGERELEMRRE